VLRAWTRTQRINTFHGQAGIGWEGHEGISTARAARVTEVLHTEHLPYLITDSWQRLEYAHLVSAVDRLICVSEVAYASFVSAGSVARP